MAETSVQVARELYEAFARGDVMRVLALFDERIEWREAEGNPYQPDGRSWTTLQEVTVLFQKLATEWDRFTVTPTSTIATSDGALTQGRYTGTYKANGRAIDAQFAHVWTIRNGKITAFQQYVDTAQMQAVMESPAGRTTAVSAR